MNNYKEYIELEAQLAILEDKKKTLRENILADLTAQGKDKDETEYGVFSVCYKINWVYTAAVKKMEEKVKLAKVVEQEKGKAKASETTYLMVKKNDSTETSN